jgi:hypothetical protein
MVGGCASGSEEEEGWLQRVTILAETQVVLAELAPMFIRGRTECYQLYLLGGIDTLIHITGLLSNILSLALI